MNVLAMVRDALAEGDFDGLANPRAGCACLLADLAPCGEVNGEDCVAGYRMRCPSGEHEFDVVTAASREEAEPSCPEWEDRGGAR